MKKTSCLLISGFVLVWLQPLPAARVVKITSLGSRTGEFCGFDRTLLLEDPSGVRILYDPGFTVAGGSDPRLGAIDVILLSHAHLDHIGDPKLNQNPDAPAAGCANTAVQRIAAPNSNLAEIAAVKNSAVVVARHMATFVGGKVQAIRGAETAACPMAGPGNELTVPRTSPCTASLDFGGKRTVTRVGGSAGVQIAIVPAHHENNVNPTLLSDPLRGQLVANGLPASVGLSTGYVLTFSNGLSVYLTGDTGLTSEMETVVNRFYRAPLAVVNFDEGTQKMGPEEAAFAMIELVKPQSIIPIHMNEVATTGGVVNAGTRTARFLRLMDSSDIPVYVPRSGVTMEFDDRGHCVAGCDER